MNEKRKDTLLYAAYVTFAITLVAAPWLAFLYFNVDASFLVTILVGFMFAGFVLSAIDLILAMFSHPGIMAKRLKAHREKALKKHNQLTK